MISSSFQSSEKYPPNDSGLYALTLNDNSTSTSTSAIGSSDLIAENYHVQSVQSDAPSKDIVCWTLNESSSEIKRTNIYFIVPPENVNFAQQDNKAASFADFCNITYPQNLTLHSKNDILNNFDKNIESNHVSINPELFDYKLSPSTVISEESANLKDEIYRKCNSDNSDISSFDERLSKRDSLLPQRYCKAKRIMKRNKYKFSAYSTPELSYRNVLKQSNDDSTSPLREKSNCKRTIKSCKYEVKGAVEIHHCPYCRFSSPNLSLVKYHIRHTHNRKNKLICKLCQKIFFRIHDLKLHLNVHLKLKYYICDTCGLQFSHSSNLTRHLRIHTKVRPYSCPICDQRFTQLPSLLSHQISHTSGGKCPDCDALFRSTSGLSRHAKLFHKRKLCSKEINKIFYKTYDNTFVKSRFFNCRVCSERFQYKKGLRMHEEQFHSNSSIPCKNCFKIFPTNEDFMSHACLRVNKKHQPKSDSTFKCSVCFQTCKSFKDAECHICESVLSKRSLANVGITVIPEANSNPEDVVVLYFNNIDDDENCISVSSSSSVNESSGYLEGNQSVPLNKQTVTTNSLNDEVNTSSSDDYKTIVAASADNEISNKLSQNKRVRNPSDDDKMFMMASTNYEMAITDLSNSKTITNSDNNKTVKEGSVTNNIIEANLEDKDVFMTHSPDNQIEATQSDNNTVVTTESLNNDMVMTESMDNEVIKSRTCKRKNKKRCRDKDLPMKLENLVQSPTTDSKGREMSYKCTYCAKKFSKMWNWSQHMGTHDVFMRNYTCEICSIAFSYRSTFTNHMKTHSSADKEEFSCTLCVKTYNSRGGLNHHIRRVHEQKQNYFCNECSKGFYVKSTYMYHLRLHKKELIYICCFCGRKFSHLSHLRRHEKIHTGEKPHKCLHCPKSFIQPVTLRTHLRKHHGVMSDTITIEDQTGNDSFKEVGIEEVDGKTEKEFAVITMGEISDLGQFTSGVPDEFGAYVGIDTSI